jgi:hypothetical protein
MQLTVILISSISAAPGTSPVLFSPD